MQNLQSLMRPHMVKIATYHGVDPSEELARKAGIRPELSLIHISEPTRPERIAYAGVWL